MEALATKYRPKRFEDIVAQEEVKTILSNQIETDEFKQAYLFCGSAGTGKTTSARIFANCINKNKGKAIEIDGASNNGVDNIRTIIDDCKMKSLDSKYKVYIIDEVHMLSIGAFNALLKVLEEPPKSVIFILCTTDPQKIPATILSRVQRFDFKRIPTELIYKRLQFIVGCENNELDLRDMNISKLIEYEEDALWYIAKLANGGMRDAIMKLDTILGYTTKLTTDKVQSCLGITRYEDMYYIICYIQQCKAQGCIEIIDRLFNDGKDLKLFVKDLSVFVLDLCKYSLTRDFDITLIPSDLTKRCDQLEANCGIDLLITIMDSINKLNNTIKYEANVKPVIESELILLCR